MSRLLKSEMMAAVSAELDGSIEGGGHTPRLEAALGRLHTARGREQRRIAPRRRLQQTPENSSDSEEQDLETRLRLMCELSRCRKDIEAVEAVRDVCGGTLQLSSVSNRGVAVYGTMLDSSRCKLLPMGSADDAAREKVPLGTVESRDEAFTAFACSCALGRLWERAQCDDALRRLEESRRRGRAIGAQLVQKSDDAERLKDELEAARQRLCAAAASEVELVEARKATERLDLAHSRELEVVEARARRAEAAADTAARARDEERSARELAEANAARAEAMCEQLRASLAAESARAQKFDEAAKRLAMRFAVADNDAAEANATAESLQGETQELRQAYQDCQAQREAEVLALQAQLQDCRSDAEAQLRVERQRNQELESLCDRLSAIIHGARRGALRRRCKYILERRRVRHAWSRWQRLVGAQVRRELRSVRAARCLSEERCAAADATAKAAVASVETSGTCVATLRDFGIAARELFAAAAASEDDHDSLRLLCEVFVRRAQSLAACQSARVEVVLRKPIVASAGNDDNPHTCTHLEVRDSRRELLAVLRLGGAVGGARIPMMELWCESLGYALETRRALDDAARALRDALAATRRTTEAARSRADAAAARADSIARLVRAVAASNNATRPPVEWVAQVALAVYPTATKAAVLTTFPRNRQAAVVIVDRSESRHFGLPRDARCLELSVARGGAQSDDLPSCLGSRVACVAVPEAWSALSIDISADSDELLEAIAVLASSSLKASVHARSRFFALCRRVVRQLLRGAWRALVMPTNRRVPDRRPVVLFKATQVDAPVIRESSAQTSAEGESAAASFARLAAERIENNERGDVSFVDVLRVVLTDRVTPQHDSQACARLASALDSVASAASLLDAYALLRETSEPDETIEPTLATALGVANVRLTPVSSRAPLRRGKAHDVGGETFFVERFGRRAAVQASRGPVSLRLVLESFRDDDARLETRAAVGACAVARAAADAAARCASARRLALGRAIFDAVVDAANSLTRCASAAAAARVAAAEAVAGVSGLDESAEWRRFASQCQAQARTSILELDKARQAVDDARDEAKRHKKSNKLALKRAAELAAHSRDLENECRRLKDELATIRAAAKLATLVKEPDDDDSVAPPPPLTPQPQHRAEPKFSGLTFDATPNSEEDHGELARLRADNLILVSTRQTSLPGLI